MESKDTDLNDNILDLFNLHKRFYIYIKDPHGVVIIDNGSDEEYSGKRIFNDFIAQLKSIGIYVKIINERDHYFLDIIGFTLLELVEIFPKVEIEKTTNRKRNRIPFLHIGIIDTEIMSRGVFIYDNKNRDFKVAVYKK